MAIGFDIYSTLRTYCNSKDIVFIAGSDEFANIDLSQKEITDHNYILVCDLDITPVVRSYAIQEYEYTGLIMLGRKFDPTLTESSLDENFEQKWDNRLNELFSYLTNLMIDFTCVNGLSLELGKTDMILNKYDENVDFVVYQNIKMVE